MDFESLEKYTIRNGEPEIKNLFESPRRVNAIIAQTIKYMEHC
jgi:hypothetical protein